MGLVSVEACSSVMSFPVDDFGCLSIFLVAVDESSGRLGLALSLSVSLRLISVDGATFG